jgi:preprotein translocase subunit SecA
MFDELQSTIRHEVVHIIYQFEIQVQPAVAPPPPMITPVVGGAVAGATATVAAAGAAAAPANGRPEPAPAPAPRVVRASGPGNTRTMVGATARPPSPVKLGRNDPCWCGSGKKYKMCHGQG